MKNNKPHNFFLKIPQTVKRQSLTKIKVICILLIFGAMLTFFGLLSHLAQAQSGEPAVVPEIQQESQVPQHPFLGKNIEELQTELPNYSLEQKSNAAPETIAVGGVDTGFTANVTEGNSEVLSLATQPDGKFLVGGNFSGVNGVPRRGLERFNADGTRDTSFNPNGTGANAQVFVILVLPDGRIMIAGFFSTYNGANAPRIARLNPDGTLDPTFTAQGTSINSGVQDMIIQPDGKILVSSNFTSFNGVTRNAVARLNADGTLDTAFDPNINSGGFVEELILQPDGKIVIGGVFTTVGGTPRNSIARLNANGTLDTSFNVGNGVQSGTSLGSVFAAERQADGKILIGGVFSSYSGVARQNIARINPDGSLDTSFNPNTSNNVEFIAIQPDGKIVVVGFFGAVNTQTAAGIVRLNPNGSIDSSFNGGAIDSLGYVVALQADGKILFGGFFTKYAGADRRNIVRLNPNGTPDSFTCVITLEPIVYTTVRQSDGKILIGGQFRRVNGVERRNIARLNADGTLDTSFNPGTGADDFNRPFVYSIAVQDDNKILVGGAFGSFNGTPRNRVARLNANGSLDGSFVYNDAIGLVRDIEVRPNGKIVLAGLFQNVSEEVFSGIVKLNSDGSYDQTAVGTGANGTVTRITPLADGRAMIVGAFSSYNETTRNRIARINDNGTLDLTFNPGTGASATAFDVALLPNGQMYVGGQFANFNGAAGTTDIVRLNSNGSVDTTFNSGATAFNGSVFALSLEPDNKILAGGNFISYNGTSVNQLALLNTNGSLDTTFPSQLSPGLGNDVEKLTRQPDGKTLVSGIFTGIGGVSRSSIARLNASAGGSCSTTPIIIGQSINGSLNSNSCLINGSPTDLYTFSGTAGQQIVISLDSAATNGIQPLMNLVSVNGTTVLQGSSGGTNARIPSNGSFQLPSTGNYTIRVSTFGGFGDYTLSLSQQPAITCTYTLSSANTNVGPSGGTFFFDVVTGVGCPTVLANYNNENPWLTIISNSGGRVTFVANSYNGVSDRSESIIVAGQTHTVRQFGINPPSNDFFVQAALLPGISGNIVGRNFNTTAESGEPMHARSAASKSVWYKWTAPSDGLYSFTTSGSDFDTVLAIYTGSTVNALTRIAENDDTTSFDPTSKINFRATAGVEYRIAVDGKNRSSGNIRLRYSPFRRLFRLYLQNFNGFASPITPESVVARRQDGTGIPITGIPISLGVYEFDLPEDNAVYVVTISGPNGITWQPSGYIINNSSAVFNRLMEEGGGQSGNGQNQTSNATNTIPRVFKGYIHGISTQPDLNVLRVRIASTGSSSSVAPVDCLNPILQPGGPGGMRVLYDCVTQPNTVHQIVPSAPNKAFLVPVLDLINPLTSDTGPASANAIIATTAPTFNIGGRVLVNGQGLGGATIDIFSGAMTARTTSAGNGDYVFPNLAPNLSYTLRTARDGFIFQQPPPIILQSPGATVNITAQTCAYTFSGNGNFSASGGLREFSVTATTSQGCEWSATRGSNSEWIAINSGSSVGDGLVQFTVQQNNGSARSGSIIVGEQSFTITQADGCTYSFNASGQSFPATGGTGSFNVTRSSGSCPLAAVASDYCMISLSAGNGVINFTVANNLGVARTATITLGGQTFTINQAAAPGTHRTRFDFDGDGKADIAVYRPSNGGWYLQQSTAGFTGVAFGVAEDIPVAADYDGDGKADIAVYRPSNGVWYLQRSTAGFIGVAFGVTNDIPQPADFDNDGKAELAIFRPSNGTWYTFNLTTNLSNSVAFGQNGDKPVVGDYDGDRKADYAVYRSGTWYIQQSALGFTSIAFGVPTDKPMPADYDGDGKTDVAVFRPSNGTWYLQQSMAGFAEVAFGTSGDIPVAADYNGDKKADVAVFRPSNGTWYILSCTNQSQFNGTPFGFMTDIPVENPNTP